MVRSSTVLSRKEEKGDRENNEAQNHNRRGIPDHVAGLQSRDAEQGYCPEGLQHVCPGVAVADGQTLRVTYTTEMTFPA